MKVYWSRCGYGHGNFGDKLTLLLLQHFGVSCEWAPPERAELIGVGSVLEKAPENFHGIIWTTGLMHEHSRKHFSAASAFALRGKLTQERVHLPDHQPVSLGDAGLLCYLFNQSSRKRYKLGIIPHFVDAQDPIVSAVAKTSREIIIIDVCAPTSDVIDAVAACEHVVSSSLHGLILADSLGVPNRWIELNRGAEIVSGGGFKFRDYYSIYDIPTPTPVTLRTEDNLNSVLSWFDSYSRPGLENIKRALLGSLTGIVERQPRPAPGAAGMKIQEQQAWLARLGHVAGLLEKALPPSAIVVLADDDQLKGQLPYTTIYSFTERDGHYWGPPGTAHEAINELQRLRGFGAEYFVVPFLSFWLFDTFAEFAEHVLKTCTCVIQTDDAVVYRL